MGPRSIGNIVINAHREGVRLLEHHTYPFSQKVHIHAIVDVLPFQRHLSGDSAALNQIIHPVQSL